ncbi:type I-B CRISPR-associated protein Cas7/Cst2/DevR [Brachyspira catarrhinii]|uniref:Type I-B CRISPR-associated protein Cas7/Cst2/DevR n=1 Tax=Brachyspira catarrhinii TaxID=2528966 RepID=A0ABY2TX13_9SPIR|nr:type I-B CRISPR-associated protein Cas7/Cst2/DevR [Brachyspira catarrhinii]TKZ36102.1 type I-B CRISPR-associated protein Cas7/Cst2/DevR [Brachyspira catarrhinii]
MENKGLTLSIIFEADSANYGEGYGNVSALKRISRADGNSYSYISRQALIFSLKNNLGWLDTETAAQGKVAQYTWDSNIKESPEIDLFGYMKTKSKDNTKSKNKDENETEDKSKKGENKIRAAVVRFSNAISLENYSGDMEFGTNLSLANRTKDKKGLLPYNAEIHKSYYTYTVTVDLDLVGVDKNDNIDLQKDNIEECKNRITKLLEGIEFLHREIKADTKNMNPIFAIGGIYNIKNPFFANRLELIEYKKLNVSLIKEILDSINSKNMGKTYIGCLLEKFSNGEEIKSELKSESIVNFFNKLREEVNNYYASN